MGIEQNAIPFIFRAFEDAGFLIPITDFVYVKRRRLAPTRIFKFFGEYKYGKDRNDEKQHHKERKKE